MALRGLINSDFPEMKNAMKFKVIHLSAFPRTIGKYMEEKIGKDFLNPVTLDVNPYK